MSVFINHTKRKRMKLISKIKNVLPLLFLFAINVYGQTTTNVEDIFKMWMYLDRGNVQFRGMDSSVIKGDSMYRVYYDAFTLEIEPLAVNGEFSETIYPELIYQFYQ